MARPPVRQRAAVHAAVAFGVYLGLSLLFFGRPVLSRFGSAEIGSGEDPQLFVWYLAWWPHAVLHGQNPFVTHAIWAPAGSNLAWSTSISGLALLLAPVTLAAGPVAAYNLAALLLPALAATTAFLLCRHLTRSFWPSLAGGYLFGFSSYMLGHELGHLHLTAVFLVPLAALAVLRYLEGAFEARGLALRLAPLLALQFAFSSEVFFTLTLALGAGLVVGALTMPAFRGRIRSALAPLAVSYAACAALAGAFLYYAFSDYQGVITPTGGNPADAVTFAFPTGLTEIAGNLAVHFDPTIPHVSAEDGQYLGLPTLAIVALFAVSRLRRPGSRFLLAAFALAVLATLGSFLHVRGHELLPLPWIAVSHLPLFDNVIPKRLALYVSLLAGVIVALWAASPSVSRALRVVLTGAAVLAIVPQLGAGVWHVRPDRPSFFADGLYHRCLPHGALVLTFPVDNNPLLWQAESGFTFRLANVGLTDAVPGRLPDRATILKLFSNDIAPGRGAALLEAARARGVRAVLVETSRGAKWAAMLGNGREVGGMTVYPLAPDAACRQA